MRIHRICKFLGLPDPEPIVRGTDSNQDPSINKQKFSKKTVMSIVMTFIFEE
jgi:hypothetical protein